MNALQDSKKELAYVFLVHGDNVGLCFNCGKGHQQKMLCCVDRLRVLCA